MKTDIFDFELPRDRIAQRPVSPRDMAKLLHVGDGFRDHIMLDLPQLLKPGDLLVFNDTRVIHARLAGTRLTRKSGEARVEVTLHKQEPASAEGFAQWLAFAKPAKKLILEDAILFDGALEAKVIGKEGGEVFLRFDRNPQALYLTLEAAGSLPLPPYIHRQNGADEQDREDYQTRFAAKTGAVAAPTAGLHYTDRLMTALAESGIAHTTLTLHVGAGTFLPVKVDDVTKHKMHSENGIVSHKAAEAINATRANGGRIVAVGTTVLRLLESASDNQGVAQVYDGATDIFIYPGHHFRCVDALLTNFHLPKSTLFMLVSAFAGLERMKEAYQYALNNGYRFYSYGDCSLLEKET